MSAFVGAKAYRTTAYTLPTEASNWQSIPWDAEEFDSDGFHDNSTNPSRFTVPVGKAGKYIFGGCWAQTSNIGDARSLYIQLLKNGALIKGSYLQHDHENGLGAAQTPAMNSLVLVDLADGDYVEQQNHGYDATAAMDTTVAGAWLYRTPDPTAPFVGASLQHSAAITTAANAWTAHPFNGEVFDVGGFHDNTTNNTRLTVPSGKAGYYHVGASYTIGSGAVDLARHFLRIYKNGALVRGGGYQARQSGSTNPGCWCSTLVYLADGDYVEAMYWLDGAYGLEIGSSGFWAHLVGT